MNRRAFLAKPGQVDKMIELASGMFDRAAWPGTTRIYRSRVGPFSQVIIELECESLAAYEEAWARWTAVAYTEEVVRAWHEASDTGGTNEFWTIVEE